MTDKEAIQVLAIIRAAYPNSSAFKNMSVEDASGTATVWAVQFANIPADIVLIAVNKWIADNNFPPTIFELKKKVTSLYWEVWEELDKNKKFKHLTPKQENQYKYILSVVEPLYRRVNAEPTIREIISADTRLLIGGGE